MSSTHSDHLERWLGAPAVAHLSDAMRRWYGPPIGVHGVPGAVYACGDGDFTGTIRAGYEATALDRADDIAKRFKRGLRRAAHNMATCSQLNAGFASLSALIASATTGKRRDFIFAKTGTNADAVGRTNSLWGVGATPSAGAAASAAPGGTIPVMTTAGAFPFTNPTGGDTQHFVSGYPIATLQGTYLLYDRLFAVAKLMNSTATEAVTGVPTRYTNTTAGTVDSAEGNFLFNEVQTVLPATAHNWTVCLYTNQANTASQTIPSVTGTVSQSARRQDINLNTWFMDLQAGDTGILKLTQMQCSALVATGAVDFVIGHPIAWLPCPIANIVCIVDGINTAFNLARIFDSAALSFLEVNKPSASGASLFGSFTSVAG